jgi:ribonucleoside-diphosphate reductase beta chain
MEETSMAQVETARVFQTTSERRLNHAMLPMRLYHKAKKLGVWDPRDIDFTQDQKDWQAMNEAERRTIIRLCALFVAGEEAVTLDLLPLIRVVAQEGRLEEEMYLTTFLFEEAKHTEVFRRFLDEVVQEQSDLSVYHKENYRKIFYEYLPQAMERLIDDPSPEAQAEASVTYNMIVEGVLAETGYYAFYNSLQREGKMPGLMQAIGYLKRDESRHIGYGTYLLSRLICEHSHVWDVVNRRLNLLMPYALGVVQDLFKEMESPESQQLAQELGLEGPPFGFEVNEFLSYATKQFQNRLNTLQRARGKSVDEIYRLSEDSVGVEA